MPEITLPKYLRIAAQLELRLSSGNWSERLPSLRDLAVEYETSTLTMSRSVQFLRDKGLLGRVDNTGCHLTNVSSTAEVWAMFLGVTPGEWQHFAGSPVRAAFEKITQQEGTKFIEPFENVDFLKPASLQSLIRKAVADGVQGLLLLPTRTGGSALQRDELLLEMATAEGLPTILLERNLAGHDRPLTHDIVCVDDFNGGSTCTRHLLKQGRRRIVAVVASATSSHDIRMAGYAHALRVASEADPTVALPHVLTVPGGLAKKEVDRWVADQVQTLGADGVFCYSDSVAIGLVMEMFNRGRTVPGDLAVVGYDDLPIGNLFTLGVTTYRYPGEQIVRQALRRLRERRSFPNDPPLTMSIPGELIIRRSSVAG